MRVIILRGLPGAGKSTWIREHPIEDSVVVSADHFLYEPDGSYNWTPERLQKAHQACMDKFVTWIHAPLCKAVIVDNCNLTNRDIKFYVEQAEKIGAEIEIRTITVDPAVAQARQLHGVPPEKYPVLVKRLLMPIRPDWQKYEVKP